MRALILAAALIAVPALANAEQPLSGDWDGSLLTTAGQKVRLTLHLSGKPTLDSPDQGGFCLPATASLKDGELTVTSVGGISLTGPLTDNVYAARLSQGPANVSAPFSRRPPKAEAPQPEGLGAAEREVLIGDPCKPLGGTYLAADKPGPAVLLLAGSGPTNRDGNSSIPGVRPASLRLIAQGLGVRDLASLRVDKRGVGISRSAMPSEQSLRFDQLVDDAVLWTEWLKKQPGVTCVVLVGHSEGALVATLAAERTPVCGLVTVSGSGRSMGQLLRRQARNNGFTGQRLADFDAALDKLEHGQLAPEVPASDTVLRPSVQPYAISEVSIDPAAELRKVKAPVLILHGDNDLLVEPDNAQLLAAARPDAKLTMIPGMAHSLKLAPKDVAAQDRVMANPAAPLAPGLIEAIAAFVTAAGPH